MAATGDREQRGIEGLLSTTIQDRKYRAEGGDDTTLEEGRNVVELSLYI